MSDVPIAAPTGRWAAKTPDTPEPICMCGHPLSDHDRNAGCQAAISHRPESMGGGVGSSHCLCDDPDEICAVPRRYIAYFRQSPTKKHALTRAVERMAEKGLASNIDWWQEKLSCLMAGDGECSEGGLWPLYGDRHGRETAFFCSTHGQYVLFRKFRYERATRHVKQKDRQERIEALKYALETPDFESHEFRKARGLE